MALPRARLIETIIRPVLAARLAGESDPLGFQYTLAFDEDPGLEEVFEVIEEEFKRVGIRADYEIPGNGPFLTIEPALDSDDLYRGLRILQQLFRPHIPRTATIFEENNEGRWDFQLSILGGYLSQEEIRHVRMGIESIGAAVRRTFRSTKQQADVFFITVSARNNRQRRSFLNSLQTSCGIYATVQTSF